jgi:hypothetical protein
VDVLPVHDSLEVVAYKYIGQKEIVMKCKPFLGLVYQEQDRKDLQKSLGVDLGVFHNDEIVLDCVFVIFFSQIVRVLNVKLKHAASQSRLGLDMPRGTSCCKR